MGRSESRRKNRTARWTKIQEQFKERMAERTSSGATPSTASVIQTLANDWCISVGTIEEILRKQL
jgi:hypothetical protein